MLFLTFLNTGSSTNIYLIQVFLFFLFSTVTYLYLLDSFSFLHGSTFSSVSDAILDYAGNNKKNIISC